MQRAFDFVNKYHTFFIATEHDGQPEVRAFGAICVFEGKFYFQTGRCKDVYKQLKANPKIAICCYDGEGEWLRINATAVEDDRFEASEALLEANPSLRELYAADDGNCTVFYLKDATARFCSFTKPEEVEEW